MSAMGSAAHQALIDLVTTHYAGDPRVRAVAVFGSVGTGTWHELSDVDLDIVIADGVAIDPEAEARALFGDRAAIVITRDDSADIVLHSLAETSIRWHPLSATSPNITASLRLAARPRGGQETGGSLSVQEIAAAGEANRAAVDEQRLLDTLVREAVGAWKAYERGRPWEAIVAVERARHALTTLRGRRDGFPLDPADPLRALAAVVAEANESVDFGPARRGILAQLGLM
ncbi:MAG TPA: nucleotidyltransferase domain-containing protein [Trebonia sp.]|nr:nucleotidyltransferase domain-containing protein [Trebonia sp.]